MFDAVTHLCSILHAMPTNGCARLVMLVFIHSHNRERARGTWAEWTRPSNSSQQMYPQCCVCVRKEEGSIGESGRCSRLNIEPTTGKSSPGTMWIFCVCMCERAVFGYCLSAHQWEEVVVAEFLYSFTRTDFERFRLIHPYPVRALPIAPNQSPRKRYNAMRRWRKLNVSN